MGPHEPEPLLKTLFLHPNFPGQFKLIARELAARSDSHVAAIGKGGRRREEVANIRYEHYENFTGPPALTFPPIQGAADNVRRGRSTADIMLKMRDEGYRPDYLIAHPG